MGEALDDDRVIPEAALEAVPPAVVSLYGDDLFGQSMAPVRMSPLAKRFEFAPFTVLNAREGEWQERKRAWIALGIRSELGREATYEGCLRLARIQYGKRFNGYEELQSTAPWIASSIFDPVLCELMYRWFCPAGGQIVDPFAGGSVRGIVAGVLGHRYHGIDLRQEQITANEEQRDSIISGADVKWQCGGAMECLLDAPRADFILTCPPYGDLERYSDDPRDLSTMDHATFLAAYRHIILHCAMCLKDDRLACFVVGDFRDKKTGMYRAFVADTINAFREVGMPLYNDAILVTQVGTLPIRMSAQFDGNRKLGKTHQNVLVFAKGDPRKAFAQSPLSNP